MAKHAVYPVILCGGAGSRLWPQSTPDRPKAFLALTGSRTLLQETALRVARIAGAAPPILVASAAHAGEALGEFADIGVSCEIIAEPGGRGSAPAIAAACLEILERDRDAVVLVAACDHHVSDADAFAGSVMAALPAAGAGAIVTFGAAPTGPSTAYGYILPGTPSRGGARHIDRFVEKPDVDRARELVAAGGLWNSGAFVFRAQTMLDELGEREPALLAAARRARLEARREGRVLALSEAFLAAPNLAIDVAVMEKTRHAAVLAIDYAWSDLGAWDAVLAASEKDAAGNAVSGRVKVIDSRECLIRADDGARVVVIGLEGVAVVVEGGRILVCDLASAQRVRAAAEDADPD